MSLVSLLITAVAAVLGAAIATLLHLPRSTAARSDDRRGDRQHDLA